jgi:hypothetical protein
MIKLRRLVLVIVVFLLGTGFISACTPGSAEAQASPLTESEVRAFADPVAENILQAMNTGNYTQYTRDFDEQFKENLPEERFQALNSYRTDVMGNYVSKEYWRMTQKDQKITVVYRAKFTEDPSTVLVNVYFKNISGKKYVDGLFFDSPLIRSYQC